jgi:hypothetical protein
MQFVVLFLDAIAISTATGVATPIAHARATQCGYAADGSF